MPIIVDKQREPRARLRLKPDRLVFVSNAEQPLSKHTPPQNNARWINVTIIWCCLRRADPSMDTHQRLGGLFQLTVHLHPWNSHWEISWSCCERNLITCLPHLNSNEFWSQINPLWNFNYGFKAVICPRRDRVVIAEPGEWSAPRCWQRVQLHHTRHYDSFYTSGFE